jgi:hypothetical protein
MRFALRISSAAHHFALCIYHHEWRAIFFQALLYHFVNRRFYATAFFFGQKLNEFQGNFSRLEVNLQLDIMSFEKNLKKLHLFFSVFFQNSLNFIGDV